MKNIINVIVVCILSTTAVLGWGELCSALIKESSYRIIVFIIGWFFCLIITLFCVFNVLKDK